MVENVAVVVSSPERTTNTVVTVSNMCLRWFAVFNLILMSILIMFSGIGGIVMIVLGAICIDRETSQQHKYCTDIGRTGQIILITIGCILVCCFRVRYHRRQTEQ